MKPIKTKEWKYTGEAEQVDVVWTYERIREVFPEGDGSLVDALLTRCFELEEKINNLKGTEKLYKELKLKLRLLHNKKRNKKIEEQKEKIQCIFYNSEKK